MKFFSILIFLFLFSCSSKKETKSTNQYRPSLEELFDMGDNNVVLVSPDSLEIAAMKTQYGEEDFFTLADDQVYYMMQAIDYLESKKIDYASTEKRFIQIATTDKSSPILIDTDSIDYQWMAIIKQKNQEPIVSSLIDITSAIE